LEHHSGHAAGDVAGRGRVLVRTRGTSPTSGVPARAARVGWGGEGGLNSHMNNSDQKREMLRHTVATLAYRGAKAVRGADDSFASFRASETTRTPVQILAHIGDLLDWALSIAKGDETWNNSEPLSWPQEIERFHSALGNFDDYLASESELAANYERLFQ